MLRKRMKLSCTLHLSSIHFLPRTTSLNGRPRVYFYSRVLRARPRESVVKLENRARLLNGYVSRNESVRRTFVAIGKNLCESAEVRKMSEFIIIRAFVIKKTESLLAILILFV